MQDAQVNRKKSKYWAPYDFLWLMFACEQNLWCKIRDGYINYSEIQKFLNELRKGKVLKEGRLVDGLFKYKQNQVYVPQSKLRLLVLKKNIIILLPIIIEILNKKSTMEWC
jgi:hypothetical protein